jgi:hypothetical protein
MREGLLEYVIPSGSDTRTIPLEVLDKCFDGLPRQKGSLPDARQVASVGQVQRLLLDSTQAYSAMNQLHKAKTECGPSSRGIPARARLL